MQEGYIYKKRFTKDRDI